MKDEVLDVDGYLAALPAGDRRVLSAVRAAIRKAVPSAEESISYRIPTYKLAATAVIFFAGWKKHFSLYPATPLVTSTFEAELASYEVAKGTIRIPYAGKVPLALVAKIAALRADEVAERARSAAPKKAAPKKAAPKKAAPKRAAPKRAAPKRAAPKRAAPKRAAPKRAAPKRAAPKKTAPKRAAPKKAAPKKVSRARN